MTISTIIKYLGDGTKLLLHGLSPGEDRHKQTSVE